VNTILFPVLALGAIGILAAVVLYFVAQKFKVFEDPRIDTVADLLPGANCGGCGFAGCRAFAENLVRAGKMEGFFCPVGGNVAMENISALLGLTAEAKDPLIAVVRCSGSRANAPWKVAYEGASSCYFANGLFSGLSGCPFGCLGLGDCVVACQFDAICMDDETGLPVVRDNCIACGACVEACPRKIIELRSRGKKDRRIFVSCVNKEKGAPARKNCQVACIGCGKCVKVCKFEAITLENNLAYIDFTKCTLCRKCVAECPTNAIHEINFPPKKKEAETSLPSPGAEVSGSEPVPGPTLQGNSTETQQ
jgi:Na+-translocating ferredoxin:NAD+ oxidoreductase RNF subunit RnfB